MTARSMADKDKIGYSIYEAAEATGVSDATIRRAIRDGLLAAYYPTSRAVILREELIDWIRSSPERRERAAS